MSTGPNEVHQLIIQLQSVRDTFADDKDEIAAFYSSFATHNDARITAYSKTINVLNSLQLSITFLSKHLLHPQWWVQISQTQIPDTDKQVYVNEFANFIKIAFVQGVFSAIESSLRLFLRALDPSACKGGLSEFKSIYECLFNSKLSSCPPDAIPLLDLLRLVRNTIHNNGVYFHTRGKNDSVLWNGQSYHFIHGTPIDFVTWVFLIEISDALRLLLKKIVYDNNLKQITNEITDPFSFSNRTA